MPGTSLFRGTLLLKRSRPAADARVVRVVGIFVAGALALAASAAALIPLVVRHREAAQPPVFQGSTSVYAVPLNGGVPRQILRLDGQWAFPVATADGKALILEKPLPLGPTELWRVPLDGGLRHRVGTVPIFQQLPWSADRKSFATWLPGRLVLHRLDGSGARTFGPATGNAFASWNGNFIAEERETRPPSTGYRLDIHVWHAGGRPAWSVRMPFPAAAVAVAKNGKSVAVVRMHFLELVTPHGRRVLASDAQASWAPLWTHDGTSLLYFDVKGRLILRNVTTGAQRMLFPSSRYFEETLSPDGRTVYILGMNNAVSIPK
jgi:hypothetical protein